MSLSEDSSDGDSDSEYEIITVNPNVNYESDVDEPCHGNLVAEQPIAVVVKQEVTEDTAMCIDKIDETSCDSAISPAEDDEDISMSSKAPAASRKKLNFQEYKMRRANEPKKPLFDVPKKVAAYELCDVPYLPNLVLPTDPNCIQQLVKSEIKNELPRDRRQTSVPAFNPALFEEIILVSMACNTEVSIPPFEEQEEMPTSKFLTNIVNQHRQDHNAESLLSSSTSLFSSIQAVVHGQCRLTEVDNEHSCESSIKSNEHGEDKTIMHLRKDRLRPFKCSSAVQTDNDSLFPPLLLSPSLIFNRIRNVRNYRRKISSSRSRSRSRSFSPSEDYDRVTYHNNANNNRYSRSQHSTHSSSMNSSNSGSDSDSSSCSSTQSSTDSLKRFNSRQNFRFYNRNQTDRSYNYQGEFR